MAKKKKYYVVWVGLNPGIYDSWADCQQQVKGFNNAKYKSFTSLEEAKTAFSGSPYSYEQKKQAKPKISLTKQAIEWDSIAVDAACSGNPGKMEYQGVDTATKDRLFHQQFPLGTNNIGEFLGIVHALAYMQASEDKRSIYTDSKIAMGWVAAKKCRTKLQRNTKTAQLYEVIARAEKWLKNNTYDNQILKWDTENWGEIPADFGRK